MPADRPKWVTRKGIHVNRAATAWLIRRFVDPFLYDALYAHLKREASGRG